MSNLFASSNTTGQGVPKFLMTAEQQQADNRARDVTGCFVSKEYKDFSKKSGVEAIVSYFQRACKSNEFSSHWSIAGFANPSFHPSTQLRAGNQGRDKFAGALKELDHDVCFGIAFHGTKLQNIDGILRDGLDPNRRDGQAYGPGEYFSKDPTVSVGYCKGGLEMLVFVVVLPSTLPSTLATAGSDKRGKQMPPDFLVVNNNHHQIPIGTMKFSSVNSQVLQTSQGKRQHFLQLSKEVFDKKRLAEEGKIKEQIIRYLISGQMDLAAELYEKQSSFLKETSKSEIAWFVEKRVDKGLADVFFPDLPDPMTLDELAKANIQSVDHSVREATEASQRLEAVKQQVGNISLGW